MASDASSFLDKLASEFTKEQAGGASASSAASAAATPDWNSLTPEQQQQYYAYYYGAGYAGYGAAQPQAAASPAKPAEPAAPAPQAAPAAVPGYPPQGAPGYPPYGAPPAAPYAGGYGGFPPPFPPMPPMPGYPPFGAPPAFPPPPAPGFPGAPMGGGFPGAPGGYPGAAPRFGGPPGFGGAGFGGRGGNDEPTRVVWLGNIHPDTTEAELRMPFSRFGPLEGIKVIPQKNCAFVRYLSIEDAINAHREMTGTWIHGQQVKVGWGKADPAPQMREDIGGPPPCRNLWLGNVSEGISEDLIRSVFGKFGHIEKVRILPQKNCAFVNFSSLDAAETAKRNLQGHEMLGRPLKIGYGKEDEGRGMPPAAAGPRFGDRFGDRPGFDRPLAPPSAPVAAPAPAAAPEMSLVSMDPPPQEFPPPDDPEAQKVIDKLADYVARNGKSFETNMIEKQRGNPKFAFLEPGGSDHGYYKFKLWKERHPGIDPREVVRQQLAAKFAGPGADQGSYGAVPPPPSLTAGVPTTQFSAGSKFSAVPPPGFGTGFSSAPPVAQAPVDDFAQMMQLIDSLQATKESIKTTKNFIMSRPQLSRESAQYLADRVSRAGDFDTKLNVLYLIHDILHHARTKEENPVVGEQFITSLQGVLGGILRSCFQNQDPAHQEKVTKVVKIWEDKHIFDPSTLRQLESEMRTERVHRGFSAFPPGEDRKRDREDGFDPDRFDAKRRF